MNEKNYFLRDENTKLRSSVKKLLVVSPYYCGHGGGVEIVAGQLVERLARKGWSIVWMATAGSPPPANAIWKMQAVEANNYIEEKTGVPFPWWGWKAIKKLWQETRAANVLMVHESLYIPSMLAVLVALLNRRPILLVQHVASIPYKNFWLRALVWSGNMSWTRFIHCASDKIVYISGRVLDYFDENNIDGKISLIPNGVDNRVFFFKDSSGLKIEETRPKILFVGRFVEKKGMDIVEGLAKIRSDLDFFLAGSGPIRPERWGLNNVSVLGHLNTATLAEQYRKANLLILPSAGEGFPLVVQEAMATGLAPLVSDETACALPNIEKHVYHASVDRSSSCLLENWSALIDHALDSEKCGRRSSLRADFAQSQWSWTRCVDLYDQVLCRLYKE